MSGICGLFDRKGGPANAESVAAMLLAVRHRGPDGYAVWHGGPAALGHCMLYTTPESLHERLPMCEEESGCAITADARIDNREDLFCSLPQSSHPLQTDSQLILAAYKKWGEQCADRLIGDFAFAIWDARRQTVFCACDPMGVKSLYYYLADGLFLFASEVKGLLALPEVPRRLNEMRVAEYLATLFEDRAGTFYQDILRLPGAYTMTVGRERAQKRQYWALDPHRELRLRNDAEYVEAFRDLFTETVRCRTRSAFPVGAALSGGLDSSSVACAARNVKHDRASALHTFSLVFPGLPEQDQRLIDERPQIRAVLDTGGFDAHFVEADRLSPMWQVERMHFHLDHANYAPNLYLHWAMYDAANTHGVRVFLDGFDGDSTVSHGFERLRELARTLRWPTLGREIGMLAQNHLAGIQPRRILRHYCLKPLTPRWLYMLWLMRRGRFREALSQNILLGAEFKRRTGIERRAKELIQPRRSWPLMRTARLEHYASINQALYSYTLEIADKASAAFQIEARYPFFDRRLIEFCLALPAEQKLGQGWNRWIQRRAMAGILPPEIQWRPRKGDLSPNFHRRLLDFERTRLEQIMLHGSRELDPFVNPDAMRAAFHEYEKNHARSQGESIQIFAAVNLALWLRSAGFSS